MRNEQTASAPDFVTSEYQGARLASLESDVFVPVLQALAVGAAVGLAAGVLCLLLTDGSGLALWAKAGRVAAAVGAISLAGTVVWFVLAGRAALWSKERVTDGYGQEDDTFVEPTMIRLEIHGDDKRKVHFVDLAISEDKLRAMAAAVLKNGKAFSRPALRGVLSQTEYNRVAKEMVRRGLARDLPGNKRELTAAGRAVLKKMLV